MLVTTEGKTTSIWTSENGQTLAVPAEHVEGVSLQLPHMKGGTWKSWSCSWRKPDLEDCPNEPERHGIVFFNKNHGEVEIRHGNATHKGIALIEMLAREDGGTRLEDEAPIPETGFICRFGIPTPTGEVRTACGHFPSADFTCDFKWSIMTNWGITRYPLRNS